MVNENICKHTFLKLESLFSQHLFSSILNGCCFLFDFFFFLPSLFHNDMSWKGESKPYQAPG